ncbi:MAG: hypothetical protein HFJ21_03960 [Clostridia bacterium]|nr:hypothetical protein [Clostridia bacterium]MCI9459600.1 hypothetical protein [Clostridia bacterium]
MSELFPNQSYRRRFLQHSRLPIVITDEFDFYRCVSFDKSFYGKTVSELHSGNLRPNSPDNRYSALFPNRRVSYWADSPYTARAEIKYHNPSNNLLTFWAYDDATSTFPTLPVDEPLVIIDGLEFGFFEILDKFEKGYSLSKKEQLLIEDILSENPDCLAYESLRIIGGVNYLFFEKGFYKLAIREVRLRLGDFEGKNNNWICCAGTSDYAPYLKSYGEYFMPLARIMRDENYVYSSEYKMRKAIYSQNKRR